MEDQKQKQINEIEGRIDQHRSLPFLKRLGSRVLGISDYPNRAERHELKRHKIGPWGRITEDSIKAIDLTKRLNRLSTVRKWHTASDDRVDAIQSIPVEFPAESELRTAVATLLGDEYVDKADSVGVAIAGSKIPIFPSDVEGISLNFMKDYDSFVFSRPFDKEAVHSLEPEQQAALEEIVSEVCNAASYRYTMSRLDDPAV